MTIRTERRQATEALCDDCERVDRMMMRAVDQMVTGGT